MICKNKMIKITKEQLALECNCSVSDFDKNENIVTRTILNDKRRKFTDESHFIHMITMGKNAIISADEQIHELLLEFIDDKRGHWLFEYPNLREIDNILRPYNKQLSHTHHMFLPLKQGKPINTTTAVKWYEHEEIHQFYETGKYPNALCPVYKPERPDVLAVAALEGDEIIGIAGCSADTPVMWQIGIDVDSGHRGKGIGTQLVNMLKEEILIRGKLPYYGTSLSNMHSWYIALNCGFSPAWIEAGV